MTSAGRISIGEELSGYQIEGLIGRGGMGEVYRARDIRLGRPVALKLLSPRLRDDDGFRQQLLRESRLAAGLDHPNVIPVYDAGNVDGRLFIAMRYVDGDDLKGILRAEGALSPARVVAIASQIAEALDAAHARGLIHRDVKPSNVLLDTQDGREHVYLADFGLSQHVSDRIPADGALMGTLDYVAPEQIRGEALDGRADVYALGCLLFEALTGTLPFTGVSDVALVFAHLEQAPPEARERRPDLPAAVDRVLARAMAKDQTVRYDSCGALVADLRSALGLDAKPGHSPGRVAAIAGAATAVVAALVATVLLLAGGGANARIGGAVVGIDTTTGSVGRPVPVGAHPGPLVAAAGRVWVASLREGVAWQIDPAARDVHALRTNGAPRGLGILGRTVYVLTDSPATFTGAITPYDVVTTKRGQGLEIVACALSAGDGYGLWAANCPNVSRIDQRDDTLAIGASTSLPVATPLTTENLRQGLSDLAVGLDAIWVLGDAADRRLWKIDRRTAEILQVTDLSFIPRHVAVGDDAVWVTDQLADRVVRIDPSSLRETDAIPTGRGAAGVASGAGMIWVANFIDGTVSRIDPATRSVAATIGVDGHPQDLTVADGTVWVSVDDV